MKTPLFKILLPTVALVSLPLTLYALVQDSAFHISGYGHIGGTLPIFSGSNAYNLAVGQNHLFSNSFYSAAIGTSLQNYMQNAMVVGAYNSPTSGAHFLVGNGTMYSRANAFEVLSNGNVNIPAASSSKLTVGTGSTPGGTTTTKIYGTADIDRVPNKGGISMGIFTQ